MAIEYFAESNPAARTLPRSLATRAGDFVFVSVKNVAHVLSLAGCSLADVVKTTVWLEDARDFDEFNRVYAEFFRDGKPSRSTLQATNMAGTKIEIEAIAYRRAADAPDH